MMNKFDRVTTIRQDQDTKNLRKTILKYSKDIPVVGQRYRGVFSITGYRKYDVYPIGKYLEIDVVFKGELNASVHSMPDNSWLSSEIKNGEKCKVSPIKLNGFLRKSLENDIKMRLNYFGVNFKNSREIKTIKWI